MNTTRIGFLAAVLGLALAACGGEVPTEPTQQVTSPATSRLIGTWAMTNQTFRFSERIAIMDTGRFTDDYIFTTDRVVMENEAGTWSVDGAGITLAYDGDVVGTLQREYSVGFSTLKLSGGDGTQASGDFSLAQ